MGLREVLANFQIRVDDSQLKKADGAIDSSVAKLGKVAGLFAGALSVGVIAHFVKGQIDLGDATAKSAQRLGLSVSELESWNFAADRSGVSSSQLEGALTKLARTSYAAAGGSKEAGAAFKKYGIATKNADGSLRSTSDMLPDIADALSGISSSTEKAAASQLFFGKSGTDLIPLLNEGSAGMAALRARAEELGGGLSNEFGKNAEAANDALGDVNFALTGLKSKLTVAVLPAVTAMANGLASLIGMIQKNQVAMTLIKGTLIALGIVLVILGVQWLAAFAVPLAIGLLVAAGLAAIILLVDDLVAMFKGERSVIAAFIDELYGAGTAAELVKFLTQAWENFMVGLEETPAVLAAIWKSITDGFALIWDTSMQLGSALEQTLMAPFEALEAAINRARNGLAGLLELVGVQAPNFATLTDGSRTATRGITTARGLNAALAPAASVSAPPGVGGASGGAGGGAGPVSVTINARTGASAEEIAAHASRAIQVQNEKAARDFSRIRPK